MGPGRFEAPLPSMRRRTLTVGRLMAANGLMALGLGLGRPAAKILFVEGLGPHSHPRNCPLPPSPEGWHCLVGHGYVNHADPFWPRYWRSLTGQPSPSCPLVPPGTPTVGRRS